MKASVVGGGLWAAVAASSGDWAVATELSAKESSGLQEVVVTATRRSENQQDVPVTVQAMTAADLSNQGIFETSDLNHALPNLQVSSPYGLQQPNFSLRGIGVGMEFNANAASPVGIYVDEVYQAFRASHGQQLFDLQQIEVVRGPQGTLYGRNTTGGAINFITRQPSLRGNSGNATLGYGNYDRKSAELSVEFTPVTDKLGARISGVYVKNDPYITNVLPAGPNTSAAAGASGLNTDSGISPGGDTSYGIRAIVRFEPSPAVELTLKGYGSKAYGGTEGPVPFGSSKSNDVIDWENPNFVLSPLFQALAPVGLLPRSYSRTSNGLNTSVSSNQIQGDTVGRALTEAKGGVFVAKIKLSDNLRFISVTGLDSGTYLQSQVECDATPLTLCAIGYHSDFHALNQDIRFDYSAERIKLIAGAYYGADSITANNTPKFFDFLSDVNAALGSSPSYFNPGGNLSAALPEGSLPTGIRATEHFRQDRESAAIYSEGSYKITATIRATAGLRYTKDKNDYKEGMATFYDDTGAPRFISVSDYPTGPYFIQPVGAIPASGGSLPRGLKRSGESRKVSGRVILDWKPAEQVMLYGSYSRGYRAGTFNGLAYGSANQVYFVPPEQVDAFELGLKSRFWKSRLQVNIAAFHDNYKGQQEQVVDATATANLVSLEGKIDGLEVDAQFAVTQSLRLEAALGLLHSKYDPATCPSTPVMGFPAQMGNCVASSGGPVSVGGNPFPYAAKSSANLGFDWDALTIVSGNVLLHGDAQYTGDFHYDVFGDYTAGPLPHVATGPITEGGGDYWLFNGRLTYAFDRYSISAWGKNLGNKAYYPFGISIENLFGNSYRVQGAARSFGVEVSMTF